jgi:hypothetical protein
MKRIQQGLFALLIVSPFGSLQALEYIDSYVEYTYATSRDLTLIGWQGGGVKQGLLPLFDVTYGYGVEYMSAPPIDTISVGVPLSAGLQYKLPALPVRAFARVSYDFINSGTGYDLGAQILVGESAVTVKLMNRAVSDLSVGNPYSYNTFGIAYTLMW